MPNWARPLFDHYRYKVLYGGRGAGKSVAVAEYLLIEGMRRPCRVLCAREFQISLADSVHHLLKNRIDAHGWDDFYTVQRDTILGANGTQFIFKGVRTNIQSIKSLSGITHCWLEEAQSISQESWNILVPTIREPESEIIITFNPFSVDDPVYKIFVGQSPQNAYVKKVNWDDNPYWPDVLEEERRALQETDPDLYAHVWEGEVITKTDAQILNGKWMVKEFVPWPEWDGPYFGADWGFASDPTTLVKCWIWDGYLYIEYESYAHGLEIDETADRWKQDIPGCEEYTIRADNSRPESISYVSRNGIPNIVPVEKWPGSVEDGIKRLRAFKKIIIHPRCEYTQQEARLYSYKVDRLTGDVLPTIVDKHNHCLAPDTLVETVHGPKRMDQVKRGDLVLTRKGYRRVLKAWISDRNVETYKITTSNGLFLVATGNHKIFANNAFVEVDSLRYNDSVLTLQKHQWSLQNKSSTQELFGQDTLNRREGLTGFITSHRKSLQQAPRCIYTEGFGLTTLVQSLRGITFTTKTKIPLTIQLKIWNVFMGLFTCPNIPKSTMRRIENGGFNTLKRSGRLLKLGILNRKPEKNFIENSLRILPKRIDRLLFPIASSATRNTQQTISRSDTQSSVPTLANQHGEDRPDVMTLIESAPTAEKTIEETSIPKQSTVAAVVLDISPAGILPEVWDLTVEGEHEFFANGILVHNCIDGIRYALQPIIRNETDPMRALDALLS